MPSEPRNGSGAPEVAEMIRVLAAVTTPINVKRAVTGVDRNAVRLGLFIPPTPNADHIWN